MMVVGPLSDGLWPSSCLPKNAPLHPWVFKGQKKLEGAGPNQPLQLEVKETPEVKHMH